MISSKLSYAKLIIVRERLNELMVWWKGFKCFSVISNYRMIQMSLQYTLKLLFEEGTKEETIEHLVKGTQRVIPVSLSLSVLGDRYSKNVTWMYNLRQLGTKFRSNGLDEYLFIFTFTPFSYSGDGKYPIFEWVGEHQRGSIYTGLCDNDDRTIVVGG